jgi:hypothetical protein
MGPAPRVLGFPNHHHSTANAILLHTNALSHCIVLQRKSLNWKNPF